MKDKTMVIVMECSTTYEWTLSTDVIVKYNNSIRFISISDGKLTPLIYHCQVFGQVYL